MKNNDLRVALMQVPLVWEDAQANREALAEFLEPLVGEVDLIVLPEMFTTGFTMQPDGLEEEPQGPTLQWMQTWAARTGAMLMGSLIVRDQGHFRNRLLMVRPDGSADHYDKRHLFRMAGEHESYTGGQKRQLVEWKGWRICPQVCYDLRFPVWSRNRLGTEDGYDLLVYVANWPERRVSHWKTLLQARAIENQSYVIGVNRVGEDGNGIAYSGDSAVVDALGKVLCTATDQIQVLRAVLHRESQDQYREKFPAWKDADSFTVE